MALETYRMSVGGAIGYKHPHPERTAAQSGPGVFGDLTFKVWPSRQAMAVMIRMQERRARRPGDWSPLVRLTDGEGHVRAATK